jgi:hypothetical protein
MRFRAGKRVLGEIVAIRDLQRIAAEAEATSAAQIVEEKKSDLSQSEIKRQSTEENWRRALSAQSIPLGVLGLWSAELLRDDRAVEKAASEVAGASRDLERCSRNWHLASLRCDSATLLYRKAAKDEAGKMDEKRSQDALDRFAQEGGAL